MDVNPRTLDLSNTVYSEDNPPSVIDANGTTYLVGRDTHGWLTIAHVELWLKEAGEYGVEAVGEYPYTSFPDKDKLLAAIEEA